MPTALETLKDMMRINLNRQIDCITDTGYVRSDCKYQYQILVEQAKDIRKSIEYLEELYNNKCDFVEVGNTPLYKGREEKHEEVKNMA